MITMDFLASVFLSGLSLAGIIGLMALGLGLIFGFQFIFTFAQAAFFSLGAYVGFNLMKLGLSFWVALPAVFVFVGILGMLTERYLLSRFDRSDPASVLIFTVGLGLAIVEIIRWTQGLGIKFMQLPAGLDGSIRVLGSMFPAYRLFIIGYSGVMFIVIWLFLNKTPIGLIIRAGISDREMVSALGINISRIDAIVFGLGTALAGVGGFITAPILILQPDIGTDLNLLSIVVIIVGGMRSFGGTVISALVCALLATAFLIISAPLSNIVIFLFMGIVLLVKPGGFFGEVTRYEH
ncbi:MAG: branched-chain amino acid ABC transporter permease [Planctomycetes bacterium]|nr:branched-chain amino acid ABC transporter permease [Planctomycetota bacterium]